ncbi:hypothetical protein ACIRTB_16975 [Streptomyces sp. NPDC101158]|uniref:hypothetical protein n=1 Tax=Streptomyces sp. NPDC101158 TaxID=3366117 RepID=UPI003827D170
MNDLLPPAPAPVPSEARRFRARSLWAGLLLIPATFLVVVLALASERGTACVMRGTCADIPGPFYLGTLAVALGALIWTQTTPDAAPPAPSRKAGLAVLLGADLLFLSLVAAHFAG